MPLTASVASLFFPTVQQITGLQPYYLYTKMQYDNTDIRSESERIMGGGNVAVWNDMVNAWGEEARPVVIGSSVHNQRIEHHNRAVNEQVFNGSNENFLT